MWLTKAHTSQKATTYRSGSSSHSDVWKNKFKKLGNKPRFEFYTEEEFKRKFKKIQ